MARREHPTSCTSNLMAWRVPTRRAPFWRLDDGRTAGWFVVQPGCGRMAVVGMGAVFGARWAWGDGRGLRGIRASLKQFLLSEAVPSLLPPWAAELFAGQKR